MQMKMKMHDMDEEELLGGKNLKDMKTQKATKDDHHKIYEFTEWTKHFFYVTMNPLKKK